MSEDGTMFSFGKFANALVPWTVICGTIVGVLSFFILVGMHLGPQKDVPAQIVKILERVDSVDGRLKQIEWATDALKTQANLLGNQMSVESAERNKVADGLRELKGIVDTIKASYLQRETFIEWKAEYEARTRITTPQLRKNN